MTNAAVTILRTERDNLKTRLAVIKTSNAKTGTDDRTDRDVIVIEAQLDMIRDLIEKVRDAA